jgi:hypothetical protein
MSETGNFIAIDLGAASGRVMLGQWDGRRFDLHELHRFPYCWMEQARCWATPTTTATGAPKEYLNT